MLGKQQLKVWGVELDSLQLIEDCIKEIIKGMAKVEGVVIGRCIHCHRLAGIWCILGNCSMHNCWRPWQDIRLNGDMSCMVIRNDWHTSMTCPNLALYCSSEERNAECMFVMACIVIHRLCTVYRRVPTSRNKVLWECEVGCSVVVIEQRYMSKSGVDIVLYPLCTMLQAHIVESAHLVPWISTPRIPCMQTFTPASKFATSGEYTVKWASICHLAAKQLQWNDQALHALRFAHTANLCRRRWNRSRQGSQQQALVGQCSPKLQVLHCRSLAVQSCLICLMNLHT